MNEPHDYRLHRRLRLCGKRLQSAPLGALRGALHESQRGAQVAGRG